MGSWKITDGNSDIRLEIYSDSYCKYIFLSTCGRIDSSEVLCRY